MEDKDMAFVANYLNELAQTARDPKIRDYLASAAETLMAASETKVRR